MNLRRVKSTDKNEWARMRNSLWPGSFKGHLDEIGRFFSKGDVGLVEVFVLERSRGELGGFIELKVKHMILFTWRWQPHFRYLKQLVDDGYLGRCYHADFRFLGGFGRQSEYSWRYDSHRSNGVVSDLGAHMIDFARWYIGDVAKVSAHLATFVDRPGADGRCPLIDPLSEISGR